MEVLLAQMNQTIQIKKRSAFSQFLKAHPNKHESLIVDKFTRVSVVQTSYVDHKQPFFFFFFYQLRGEGVGRGRWGKSIQGTLWGEREWGSDMRFHKILPEGESSSRCTNVVVWIHKVWGGEKCAKVPFSHWGETGKCYFKKRPCGSIQTLNQNA